MSVEVRTIEELQALLHSLWPGSRAEFRKETYATLFANDGSNTDLLRLIYEFARNACCSVSHDPDAGIIRFEKWHSPFAA
jgi:hypothetical protein